MKTFFNVEDLGDLKAALAEAQEVKANRFGYQELGKNKTLLMIFFNNSLRTRLSTQKAAMNLGMNVIVLDVNAGVNPDVVALLPATHEATGEMLNAIGYVDLCIPRGGKRLINFVRDTAKVPVIETGAGVVHCYFDKDGDVEMGKRIITNAKCRRCSVCNTLDTLIIHEQRLNDLPTLCEDLAKREVKIHADAKAYEALKGHYPDTLLYKAEESEQKMRENNTLTGDCKSNDSATKSIWFTEWMSMQLAVKTVATEDEALEHIATYGSGHSESIVSNDEAAQKKFEALVDAACVYVNAPTSFTDGSQFGLGAEIGISTQKLGARGPMALEEITTYKWLITGQGQTRP